MRRLVADGAAVGFLALAVGARRCPCEMLAADGLAMVFESRDVAGIQVRQTVVDHTRVNVSLGGHWHEPQTALVLQSLLPRRVLQAALRTVCFSAMPYRSVAQVKLACFA